MVGEAWSVALNARTLIAAHSAVVVLRPAPDASPAAWVTFRLRASAVYRRVAEIDPGHEGEARYWANREKARADATAARPASLPRSRSRRDLNGVPTTLSNAHDALEKLRPTADSSPREWVAFHQHAAEVYTEMSDVDRGHHHEALSYAAQARADGGRWSADAGAAE